ncbi:MAG TPA: tetratricopeptide repeat protein [Candidatus Sulfotelmatobacter sp.]|nr:tetratricopeptide repeat protein [Candidatus Sulfotelmatobacter sp.]
MPMYSFVGLFCLRLLPLFLLVSAVWAQRGELSDPRPLQDFSVAYQTAPGTGVLIFSVFAERTSVKLDRQALLKLVNRSNQSVLWQTTEDTSKGVFTNVPYGSYDIEVSAVGYVSTHQELQVDNSLRPAEINIVLRHDPEAVNLDVAASIMSPKARKEAKHAISLLKAGNLIHAQKELDQAYKLAPSSAELNFLLGYLYFQKKDFAQAGTYLGTAANLSPHNAQALTLLGQAGLERQDYPAARSALERAVVADADNWLPHNLLADAYLRQNDYGKARDEAQVAIEIGKSAAGPAQLVLGQALLGLGDNQQGLQALNTFLKQSPHHPLAGEVRGLIAWINDRNENTSNPDEASIKEVKAPGVDPLAALPAPGLTVKSWHPPGVDELKPPVAPAVTCPVAQVIEESGLRVQELVDDVARFAAVEDLLHQPLDPFGIPVRTETRKYNYVASISEPKPGLLAVDEYRADKLGAESYPDHIASTGFAALALVLHPHMRDNFDMICEGLGDWQGQATWLVHFRQRDDRPNRMHSYKVGNQLYSVGLKGRAWITADQFQIVRIEAEMVKPMPEIQLLSEHQVVEYGPIPFPRKKTTLWLPKSAEIYFDFRKHRYYRRHSFDHYMLYSVDTEEHRKEPKVKSDS